MVGDCAILIERKRKAASGKPARPFAILVMDAKDERRGAAV